MERESKSTTRRAVLSTIGGLAAGAVATGRGSARTQAESEYALVQGEECVPIEPVRGDQPVETFYDYQLPEKYVSDANGASVGDAAPYASAGTQDLQQTTTTITFLYRGPEGLSLVVLHGNLRNTDGGAVTFRISGLPSDGRWVVKDDLYRNADTGKLAATNYDRWRVDDAVHRIDWTWGSAGTDGGAFRDLGDEFELVVRPAFNEESPLYEKHYEGTITDWEFLTGVDGTGDSIPLDLSEPIRIETGACERGSDGGEHREVEQEEDQEHEQERDTEQETEEDRKNEHEHETEQEDETEHEHEHEHEHETEERETEDEKNEHEHETEQEDERETEQETEEDEYEDDETERETEREREEEEEEEEKEDEYEGEEHDASEKEEEGRGEGHEKGNGKGHEESNGKGHDKHDDDDGGDEDDDDDDDDDDD